MKYEVQYAASVPAFAGAGAEIGNCFQPLSYKS